MKLSESYNLAVVNPELAEEWHPTKNDRAPREVMPNSGYRAWWRYEKGHEWETTVANRNYGSGCPYCGNDY